MKIISFNVNGIRAILGKTFKEDFYKLDAENLIVIYDDIDIEFGKIRIKKSGGPGTHNGMRNIVQMLANEDFPRVRIGTDRPQNGTDLATYVLMPFTKDEETVVGISVKNAAEASMKIITNGIQSAMNEFNGL